MPTHRVTLPYWLTAHAIATAGWFLELWPYGVPLLSIALHLAQLTYGSFVPQAGHYIRHRNKGAAGTLALTYDDGPVPQHTEVLLDLLRQEGVRATFFCIGRRVQQHPELARRIVADGHTIAVHTMDHPWWWGFLARRKALHQILACAAAIEGATGKAPRYFRPPYGVTSPPTAWAMRKSGLEPVAWDLRTFDTLMGRHTRRHDRLTRNLHRASIVLMHDTAPAALSLTQALVQQARKNGTRLVPL